MRRFRKGNGKEGNTQQQSASIFGLAVLGSCFDLISYLGEFVIATEECWDRPTEWRSLLLLAASAAIGPGQSIPRKYIEGTQEGSESLVRRFGLLHLVHWLLSSFGLTGGRTKECGRWG